mmetsp:Transcript_19105/g.28295  ORF Transcript_19105/g.28295 Transcript_19105/m.28295 type:complete len:120 (-) Transcript_19105:154-513(-)
MFVASNAAKSCRREDFFVTRVTISRRGSDDHHSSWIWRLAHEAFKAPLVLVRHWRHQQQLTIIKKIFFELHVLHLVQSYWKYEKDYFANLAVDSFMRLRGSNNLYFIGYDYWCWPAEED